MDNNNNGNQYNDILAALANVVAVLMAEIEDDEVDEKLVEALGPRWTVVPVDIEAYRAMGDPSFRLHFRMTRVVFEELRLVMGQYLTDNGIIQRERTPADLYLMHVLWILATPDSFRSVALRFGVRPETIHNHYLIIVQALFELAPNYIKWPSREERLNIAAAFQQYSGFPGIVGCIDGTHVMMTAPLIQPRRFMNRYHQFSTNVQAVCDHRLLVRDIHVGEAGALTDPRVFRRSPLCRKLLTDETIIDRDQHLLGDSIYTLTDKLLTPFRNNGHLFPQQRMYNYVLSRCRSRIEHCFGKLFGQWRRLKFLHSFDFEYAVRTIVACFVLHNFMILNGAEIDIDNGDEDIEDNDDDVDEERQVLAELDEDALENLPELVLRNSPILLRLRAAKRAGVQKREDIVNLLTHLND